ncbi:MAG: hypothetical protein HW421_3804 [Ignavibacteria bacterium]|nr:hypothetical protein [Ignavibacteria bacterium]
MRYRILVLFAVGFAYFYYSQTLNAQEPLIKFYLENEDHRTYKINDIDSMNLIKSNSNYVMKIFYLTNQIAYYPTEVISKIQFDKDKIGNRILNVNVYGYPKSYKLSEVDSIYFYIDKYQPLTIGSQVWMLKNLNVDYYINGDSIPEVRDSIQWGDSIQRRKLKIGAWCYNKNDREIGQIYGKLYNWYAVNDPRGLAPPGWHVASDSDWIILTNYLGEISLVGGKLKETGTTHWNSPNAGATNESGFSALPGGYRNSNGPFNTYGRYIYLWSSTENNSRSAWNREMLHDYPVIGRVSFVKEFGFSVRCVGDY